MSLDVPPPSQGPDFASAVLALDLASSMLDEAKERFARGDFAGSMEESRNAVRVATSAILYKDGFVSDSFESTLNHLLKNYPGAFPLDEWRRMESNAPDRGYGLYHMMLQALKMAKKADEDAASKAIATADMFINSARAEMG